MHTVTQWLTTFTLGMFALKNFDEIYQPSGKWFGLIIFQNTVKYAYISNAIILQLITPIFHFKLWVYIVLDMYDPYHNVKCGSVVWSFMK